MLGFIMIYTASAYKLQEYFDSLYTTLVFLAMLYPQKLCSQELLLVIRRSTLYSLVGIFVGRDFVVPFEDHVFSEHFRAGHSEWASINLVISLFCLNQIVGIK